MIDRLKLTVASLSRPVAAAGLVLLLAAGNAAAQPNRPLVPQLVGLNPSAQAAIDAAWLTDAERRALRVFHGVWDERDSPTPSGGRCGSSTACGTSATWTHRRPGP
jgi:hypothetical protein